MLSSWQLHYYCKGLGTSPHRLPPCSTDVRTHNSLTNQTSWFPPGVPHSSHLPLRASRIDISPPHLPLTMDRAVTCKSDISCIIVGYFALIDVNSPAKLCSQSYIGAPILSPWLKVAIEH